MIISALSDSSFRLATKTASVGINTADADLSIFSSFQGNDASDAWIHWAGEYEQKGVSVFIAQPVGDHSVVKIFCEGIRVVLFNDTGMTEGFSESLVEQFGNTDIFIAIKGENGLSDADYKKLIEKVDPRIIVASAGKTEGMLRGFSFPLQNVSSVNITQEKLPSEVSEYYTLLVS